MVLGIVQARHGSRRLPGKVLKPILGRPMLAWQLERLRLCTRLDGLMLATSREAANDPIESLCLELGVPCFRGSESDVLDRFHLAATEGGAVHVGRFTADCPLIDPALVDELIRLHLDCGNDYTSNVMERTFPDGLDAEVMRASALERAWREATRPSQREHVTPFLREHPEIFRIGGLRGDRELGHLRWTVDEEADFLFVTAVFEALVPVKPAFGMDDVLQLLKERPELQELNRDVSATAGWERSLAEDAKAAGKDQGSGEDPA